MINNPVYQRQNFYYHNSGNQFYQQHPFHQHYRQNPNNQMYYHALPGFHHQNLNYHQNYYNYNNRQFYPQFNNNNASNNINNNMYWNNQNYPYQYGYQFEPIQTHYSIYPLIANNQVKSNANVNFNPILNVKKNQTEMQNNKSVPSLVNKTHVKLAKSKSDDKKIKNQNSKKKFNDKSTATTPIVKNESNEKITDFIIKNIEDTTVKIGDKYQEPNDSNSHRKDIDFLKPSNHDISDSLISSSSIDFNDLETSSEVFRHDDNDSTTIVNHIEIKLENSVDQKPKLTKSIFNNTMEELKCNNLFLAQQKKVEEYEQYEEVKKNETQELHIKLKKEYKKNNIGERSNTKKRFGLFNQFDEKIFMKKDNNSTKFLNKTNFINNEGKLKFRINEEQVDSSLGKIKFLGVYKADPENYLKNLIQKTREKTIDSMVYDLTTYQI